MTTPWPRRTPDGRIVPLLAALLRGQREAQRLAHDHNLDMDMDRVDLAELGWSLARDDVPTPEDRQHLDQLLDQLKARNQRVRRDLAHTLRWQGTGSDPGELPRPSPGRSRRDDHNAQGHDPSQSRQDPGSSVQIEKIDPITEYLRTHPDPPDKEWSPA